MSTIAYQQTALHPSHIRRSLEYWDTHTLLHRVYADCAVCLAQDNVKAALHPTPGTAYTLAATRNMDYLAQA